MGDAQELKSHEEAYEMRVNIKQVSDYVGVGLVASKDFKKGDLVLKEYPKFWGWENSSSICAECCCNVCFSFSSSLEYLCTLASHDECKFNIKDIFMEIRDSESELEAYPSSFENSQEDKELCEHGTRFCSNACRELALKRFMLLKGHYRCPCLQNLLLLNDINFPGEEEGLEEELNLCCVLVLDVLSQVLQVGANEELSASSVDLLVERCFDNLNWFRNSPQSITIPQSAENRRLFAEYKSFVDRVRVCIGSCKLFSPVLKRISTLDFFLDVLAIVQKNCLQIFIESPLVAMRENLKQKRRTRMLKSAESELLKFLEMSKVAIFANSAKGAGLYKLHSRINHSCSPNTVLRNYHQDTRMNIAEDENAYGFARPDSCIYVYALVDIEEGEEITLSYIDVDSDLSETKRKEFVSSELGFACMCAVCQ
eukprot:Nk52_evm34s229 gene=Nk52_evmTU34s229